MEKIALTDKYFRDWENNVFGFGYGTGEPPVLHALKTFLNAFKADGRSYDHEQVEREAGAQVAWLLINILCHEDILEYGTSPRYGWLTTKGELLKAYIDTKTLEQLCEVIFRDRDEDHDHCNSQYCNCGEKQVMKKCANPLF